MDRIARSVSCGLARKLVMTCLRMHPPLIVHHHPSSPHAAQLRLFLGYKRAEWCGLPHRLWEHYPVLQIAHTFYPGSSQILARLHQLLPDPLLIEDGWIGNLALLHLADGLLSQAALRSRPSEASADQRTWGHGLLTQEAALRALERQLADHRTFLGGASPSRADFALYPWLWQIDQDEEGAALLLGFAQVARWFRRMARFGHGSMQEVTLQVAVDALDGRAPVVQWQMPDDDTSAGQDSANVVVRCELTDAEDRIQQLFACAPPS